jgi:hypothetical protein
LPSEAARLARPVGARDRRVFAALALIGAAGTTAATLFFGHGGGAADTARCVSYDAAGVLGGGTWHLCGDQAAAFCRTHRDESATLAEKCDALSVPR